MNKLGKISGMKEGLKIIGMEPNLYLFSLRIRSINALLGFNWKDCSIIEEAL